MLIDYAFLTICAESAIVDFLKHNEAQRLILSEKVLKYKMNISCNGVNSYTANIPVDLCNLPEKLQTSCVSIVVDFSLNLCGSSVLINSIKIDIPYVPNIEYPSDYILRNALQ